MPWLQRYRAARLRHQCLQERLLRKPRPVVLRRRPAISALLLRFKRYPQLHGSPRPREASRTSRHDHHQDQHGSHDSLNHHCSSTDYGTCLNNDGDGAAADNDGETGHHDTSREYGGGKDADVNVDILWSICGDGDGSSWLACVEGLVQKELSSRQSLDYNQMSEDPHRTVHFSVKTLVFGIFNSSNERKCCRRNVQAQRRKDSSKSELFFSFWEVSGTNLTKVSWLRTPEKIFRSGTPELFEN